MKELRCEAVVASPSVRDRVFELDFLRFIAAFSVVLYHLTYRKIGGLTIFPEIDWVTRYGYLGVDLFFMISGFVIFWSVKDRSPLQFIVSRFSRLYPLYWISLAISVLVLAVWTGKTFQPWQLLANATMLAGYLGQDYVDGVYWTLQVELKFYLLVFLIVLAGQVKNLERWLVGWLFLAVLEASSLKLGWVGAITLGDYAPYFIAGAALYLARTRGLTILRLLIVAVCGSLSVVHAHKQAEAYLFGGDDGVSAIIVGVCYVVVTIFALRLVRIMESHFLTVLSLTTYPFYLLHAEIGRVFYNLFPFGRYISVAVVLVLCWSISYFVMRLDRPISARTKIVLYSIMGKKADGS